MPTTVTAVFQDGVLKPTRKLKLRPHEKVTLHIVRKDQPSAPETLGRLAGAFPELARVSGVDLLAAKRTWERSLTGQRRRLGRKGSTR